MADQEHQDLDGPEAATQAEIEEQAREERDDPTTRREEVELDRMEARAPEKR